MAFEGYYSGLAVKVHSPSSGVLRFYVVKGGLEIGFVFANTFCYNYHMRNYRDLKAFNLADGLVLRVYEVTRTFPKHELFGLTSQLRRAAVSVPSNIVEGACRETELEFLRFLDMAYGSASELDYQISLAHRLGYIPETMYSELREKSTETAKVLNGLIRSLRHRPKDSRR